MRSLPLVRSTFARTALALGLAALAVPAVVAAQQGGHQHGAHAHGGGASGAGADSARLASATDHAMAGHHDARALRHLEMTARRPATVADSARASAIVATLRAATAKYRDVRRAEADGYRLFAPQVKEQRVFHYTKRRAAVREAFRFDAAQPTSLLYVKGADGTMQLLGAMYTAPKRTSEEELDRRVPLSMAQWHRHVNLCVPRRGETARWREPDATGAPKFGPAGSIATESACDAERGRWLDSIFGWMVHVNAWAEDPKAVFEH